MLWYIAAYLLGVVSVLVVRHMWARRGDGRRRPVLVNGKRQRL